MEETQRVAIRGVNGTLVVMPDYILIKRRRALASLDRGRRSDRKIAIAQIVDTRLKVASPFINGYIQFSLEVGPEGGRGGYAAAQDDNAVMFTKKQQPGFERAKAFVDGHREATRRAAEEPSV